MSKNIFIAASEHYSGKSIVALGLINMLLSKTQKVGYFKPIINADPSEKRDDHISTVKDYFNLPFNEADAYAFTRTEALQLAQNMSQGEMIETIINKFKKLEETCDFVVIEGSDYVGEGIAFELDGNISIAKNLSAPVIVVVSGASKTTAQIITNAITVFQNFKTRDVQVLAMVVNIVDPKQVEDVKKLLGNQLPKDVINVVIPVNKSLKSPTLKEIHEHMGGNLLFGKEQLSNQADHFITGAMQVPRFLNHLKENVVIVTPGDRGDIIVAAMLATLSTKYPKVSGMVLSADAIPEEPIMRLIEGSQSQFPIISVKTGTFDTTSRLSGIQSRITADNPKRIQLAIDVFEDNMDTAALEEKIIKFKPEGITPHMFQYQLTK